MNIKIICGLVPIIVTISVISFVPMVATLECCQCGYVGDDDGFHEECNCRTDPEKRNCVGERRGKLKKLKTISLNTSSEVYMKKRLNKEPRYYGRYCVMLSGTTARGSKIFIRMISEPGDEKYVFDEECYMKSGRLTVGGDVYDEGCVCNTDWCNCVPVDGASTLIPSIWPMMYCGFRATLKLFGSS